MEDNLSAKVLHTKMNNIVEGLRKDFSALRTGRASPSLLDHLKVNAYGSPMPIAQVGTVNAPEARMLSIQVWDGGLVKAVEKAILDSDLGLNPAVEGTLIRLRIPDLNEERRRELTKVASQQAEHARIAVRNSRRDRMDLIKRSQKDGEISEDEGRRLSDETQKITDEYIHKIDEALAQKEKDIMTV